MTITNPDILDKLAASITPMVKPNAPILIGVAGAPASGKSTLAEELVAVLNAATSMQATILPMDGFHLDNRVLREMDALHRKGAPHTFDFDGLKSILQRVRAKQTPIYTPTFDRAQDISIAGANVISNETNIVVVEGNYLLLDVAPWRELKPLFDFTVFIEVDIEELRKRLVQRWLDNGHSLEGAKERANSNDIPNAQLVAHKSLRADIVIGSLAYLEGAFEQ